MGHTGCRRSATSRSIVTRGADVRTGTRLARVEFGGARLNLLLPEVLEFHRRRNEPDVTAFFYQAANPPVVVVLFLELNRFYLEVKLLRPLTLMRQAQNLFY